MASSRITLSTRNLQAVKANLRQYSEQARARAAAVVTDIGQKQYERTYELCPVLTGHMRDHIQLLYTPGGLGYQIGWDEPDFVGNRNIYTDELIKSFYPLYQEFGTTQHSANPCLFPARDEYEPIFKRELAKALSPRSNGRGRN